MLLNWYINTVDVNTVLNSHFYTGKKHKLVAQDVRNDHFIQANSGNIPIGYLTVEMYLSWNIWDWSSIWKI